jgi:hypothetical protein
LSTRIAWRSSSAIIAGNLRQGQLQALELGFRCAEGLLKAFTLCRLLRGSKQRRDLTEQSFEDR